MKEKQIRQIFEEDNFTASVFQMETAEEMLETFEEKGLKLTLEEVSVIGRTLGILRMEDNLEMGDILNRKMIPHSEVNIELGEEYLKMVAGGVKQTEKEIDKD